MEDTVIATMIRPGDRLLGFTAPTIVIKVGVDPGGVVLWTGPTPTTRVWNSIVMRYADTANVWVDRVDDKGFAKHVRESCWEGPLYSNTVNVGADFELFLTDNVNTRKLVPAWTVLGEQVPGMYPQLFADGFAAESTITPCTCHERVAAQVVEQILGVTQRVPGVMVSSKVCFNVRRWLNVAGEHARLGCEPSQNAYGELPLSVRGEEVPFRSVGFHVHYGVPHTWLAARGGADAVVRDLDAIGGVVMVAVTGQRDDRKRRRLYGRAGEYRLPKWGLEYRVGSAGMAQCSGVLMLCLDFLRAALWNGVIKVPWEVAEDEVRRVINTADVVGARRILRRNKKSVEMISKMVYGPEVGAQTAKMLMSTNIRQKIAKRGWTLEEMWRRLPLKWASLVEQL